MPPTSSNSDSDSSHPSPPEGSHRRGTESNSNNSDAQQKRSRDETMSSGNNNNNGNSNKGYAYSCTGLSLYSSDLRAKNQLPACIGITGRLKEVELIHDGKKALKQKHAANIAHRKSLTPVLPPTKDTFHVACLGYSQIILQGIKDQRQQQESKFSTFQSLDGKVMGLPICEAGVHYLANNTEHPTPALPIQTSDNRRNSYSEVEKEQQGSTVHSEEEELTEESMDREIKKIRERYRQVLEQNETDPNTWKRREQSERYRRMIIRQHQQQRMMEKLREEQKKRKRVKENNIVDALRVSFAKWKKYALKLPQLTYAEMKRNGTTIYTELTRKDLPRRVWNSSERIVQNFGSSARLCQKAFSRSKDTIMESLDFLIRTGRGSDKKK